MIKHPLDREQRRLIREAKAKKKAKTKSVKQHIKLSIEDQESTDELREFVQDLKHLPQGQRPASL